MADRVDPSQRFFECSVLEMPGLFRLVPEMDIPCISRCDGENHQFTLRLSRRADAGGSSFACAVLDSAGSSQSVSENQPVSKTQPISKSREAFP